MAIVPIVERVVDRRGAELPVIQQQDVSAGGRALAQGLGAMAGELEQTAWTMERAEALHDQAIAKQADADFVSAATVALNDPSTGYLTQRGLNAVNQRADVLKALADQRRKLLEGARSPRTRAALGPILDARLVDLTDRVNRHAAAQAEVAETDASKARIGAVSSAAISVAGQAEAFDKEMATLRGEIDNLASRNGWAPETREAALLEARTAVHAGVVDRLADTSPEAAMDWLTKRRDAGEIDPKTADRLADSLRPAVEAASARRDALAVLGIGQGQPENAPREHDMAALLAKIDKMDGTDDHKARVKDQAMKMARLDEQLLRDQQSAASDRAWEMLDAGKKPPPSLLALMSPESRRSLRKAMDEGPGGSGGFSQRSSVDLLVQAENMAAFAPGQFAKIDLNAERGNFSRSDWLQLVAVQRRIRAGGGGPKDIPFTKVASITRDLAEAAGLTMTGKKGKVREQMAGRIAAFRQKVREDTQAFIARHGRQPDDDEIRAFADRWLTRVTVEEPGMMWGTNDRETFYFEAGKGDARGQVRFNPDNVAVPDAFRDRFTTVFQRENGRLPTEGEVGRAFLAVGNR